MADFNLLRQSSAEMRGVTPAGFNVGDRVTVQGYACTGTVQFVGAFRPVWFRLWRIHAGLCYA